jgi:hypothetical protein
MRKCIGCARNVHDEGFIQFSSGARQAGFMLGYRFALQGTAGR